MNILSFVYRRVSSIKDQIKKPRGAKAARPRGIGVKEGSGEGEKQIVYEFNQSKENESC